LWKKIPENQNYVFEGNCGKFLVLQESPWLVGFFGFGFIFFILKAMDIFNFEWFLSLKINLKFNIICSQLALFSSFSHLEQLPILIYTWVNSTCHISFYGRRVLKLLNYYKIECHCFCWKFNFHNNLVYKYLNN
jgi:hypothetical protein